MKTPMQLLLDTLAIEGMIHNHNNDLYQSIKLDFLEKERQMVIDFYDTAKRDFDKGLYNTGGKQHFELTYNNKQDD